ncbi:Soluble epoxide hydrolase [Aquisphaera giovannonii]|uniref:Soluble epoxide hydrolase n=1 Tax=Aquisphaera giovannonii TaxID=406548 RepID=A0A5B9W7R3_9BACT|nr:alpha/beta hydrolase [Aquisphaera giovannonii]QEH35960.1 Soluble epoxide hydrolase [Aquisphaera giovannonii]
MGIDESELRDANYAANGIRIHAAEAGPPAGPAVILLHGFPEFWYGWRHQIGPLAAAGFRVIAPDQRGYNTSDKPGRVADYALDVLAADVVGLIEAAGLERASLVGHDWGGLVAWWVAARHPERVERLAILNAPHPAAYRRVLRSSPKQWLKSWYVAFFQVPKLPEALSRLRGWRAMADGMRASSRPGTFSEADFDRYREAWSRPGAITAMINWYRALVREGPPTPEDARIRVPTRILWGANDRFIERRAAADSLALCDRGELEMVEGATHWLQHEEPELVNRRLIEFLSGDAPPRG